MPWYRIFANHGPGHQSTTEYYHWHDKPLVTKEDRKEAWESVFDDPRYDWPIGDVELCERLPQHILDEKIVGFESSIDRAYKMLTVLRETPTKPVICVRYEINSDAPDSAITSGYQARLMNEPSVIGPKRQKKDEAVDALLQMFRRENRKVRKAKSGGIRYSRRSDYAVITR
jgi:hypothetical protein